MSRGRDGSGDGGVGGETWITGSCEGRGGRGGAGAVIAAGCWRRGRTSKVSK